jgi:asparagine synthase (glutamine-hydrolysing)
MCGICGYFGQGGPETLAGMNDLMVHRGPDSNGAWIHGQLPVGLAMRRLSIVDLETGEQPMFNEDRSVVLVFNGEIYNYRDLRDQLTAKGHTFTTHSDTEVIVHGYEEYSQDILERLKGMFAFALWDENKKRLLLARDRLGIKPLYYAERGRNLHFASEQKPILSTGLIPTEPDSDSLIRNLLIGFYTGPVSMFQHIKQLPPGHGMFHSDRGSEVFRYWSLPMVENQDDYLSDETTLLEMIAGCVDSHLIGDVPIGLTLSGGLDSSLLAVFMAQKAGANLKSHTLGFGVASDETPFARQVLASLGLRGHERNCTPAEALESLPAMMWHLEEPLSNITAITAYQWAKFVAQDMKVTLIGEGADELFGGYLQYYYYQKVAGLLPRRNRANLFGLLTLQPGKGFMKKLLSGSRETGAGLDHIYEEEYLRSFSSEKGLRPVLRFDIEHQLSNNQLMRIDRMTMAHSLEARVPYLDHELVETAWRMPDEVKIKGRSQKHLLRKACKGILPDSILERPKTGPGGSQALYPVLFSQGLQSLIGHVLRQMPSPLDRFCPRTLGRLLEGKAPAYPLIGGRIRDKLLWSLFLLVLWWELFIKRQIWRKEDIPSLQEIWPQWVGPSSLSGGR